MSDFFDLDPEQAFRMITIMPKNRIKVLAYLEDQDGDRITFKEIADELVDFVEENMTDPTPNQINAQMFPLTTQFMSSVVPKFVGNNIAAFLFAAPQFAKALSMLSLSTALLMQYIQQHNLKIVTETETLTDEELQLFTSNQEKASKAFLDMFSGMQSDELEDEEDEEV